MDKVLNTNDPPLIANEVHKLYESILQRKNNNLDSKEIKKLKSLCGHENPRVSLSASNAIQRLATVGQIDLLTAYSWLSSSIFIAKNINGLIQLAVDLFILDVSKCKENTKLQFSKHSQGHPFVEILKCSYTYCFPVLTAMECICHNPDEKIAASSMKFLSPVFKFILSSSALPLAYRNVVWDMLIDLEEVQLIIDSLTQLTLTNVEEGFEHLHVARKLLANSNKSEVKSLIISITPSVACVVQHFVKNGIFLDQALNLLMSLILKAESASSLALMILAETVPFCSIRHLLPLLNTCLEIMQLCRCSIISEYMLVASLMRWLIQPTFPATEVSEVTSAIIKLVFSRNDFYYPDVNFSPNDTFLMISASHGIVQKCIYLLRLSETLHSKHDYLTYWLDSENTNFGEFTLFLRSLLLCSSDRALKEKVIRNLSKVKPDQQLATFVFQLVREKDPKIQSKLLSSMHLCINRDDQENKLIILQILKGMSSSNDPVLKEQSIYQYFLFWKMERRCFPFLHAALVLSDSSSYEIDMTKAKVINEICKISPEIHGKNIARPISDILNKSQFTQPCIFALNSVALLCKAGEIDIQSTWNALKPKFIDDKRPEIIERLCEILSLVPSFYSYLDIEKQDFFNEVVTTLWRFVTQKTNENISCAGLKAFSSFRLDQLSLDTLPDIYKENAEKAIKTALANSVAEFVYIPGKCWLKVLESLPASCHNEAANLFSKWLSDEITTFHSGIYRNVQDESTAYTFLQERSLCRTLVDYIRKHSALPVSECVQPTVSLCLQILSRDLPKPLPPLKWTFLLNYMNEGSIDVKSYATKLAIKQATHNSSSANNIIEAKLSKMAINDQSEEEIKRMFESFVGIYHRVHTSTAQAFVSNSLQFAAEQVKQNKTELYATIIGSIKFFLGINILKSNEPFLLQTLHDQWKMFCQIPVCSQHLIDCISVLHDHQINEIFPEGVGSIQSYIKLVCDLASIKRTMESISRLTNLVSLVCSNSYLSVNQPNIEDQSYLQNQLLPIFALSLPHSTVLFFVKGVMGLIEYCDVRNLEYLCTILIRVIIVNTGLSYCPSEEYSNLPLYSFPLAVAHFFSTEETFSIQPFFTKMSEVKAHRLNISCSLLFKQCLVVLDNLDKNA